MLRFMYVLFYLLFLVEYDCSCLTLCRLAQSAQPKPPFSAGSGCKNRHFCDISAFRFDFLANIRDIPHKNYTFMVAKFIDIQDSI